LFLAGVISLLLKVTVCCFKSTSKCCLKHFYFVEPENKDFLALLEASGWGDSEAARELELNRATISHYRSGSIKPSRQVLRLFKLILLKDNPSALSGAVHGKDFEIWETKLIDQLRPLHVEDRQHVLRVIKTMVAGFRRAGATKPPALTPAEQANVDAAARKGAASALKGLNLPEAPIGQKKHKAASTSGKTAEPKPAVPLH
jgi:hypothetical protein